MKLKVTNEVPLSNQLSAQNIIGTITAHTGSLLSTGKIQCDLTWFVSENAEGKKCDAVWPVIFNGDNILQRKVAACEIQLTEQESTGANLPLTIYNKVAQKLSTDYDWTVEVI